MSVRALSPFLLFGLLVGAARAEFSAGKLALIDRPFVGEQIAMAPDGRRFAYTVQGDGRHLLFIADIDRKVSKMVTLSVGQAPDRPYRGLNVLRWMGSDRLLLQDAAGEIVAIDADGGNAARLWSARDNGLVNDFTGSATFATAGSPRVLQLLPPAADQIFVESSALVGVERLANLHRIDVRTGVIQIAHQNAFYEPGRQIALYGPGQLLGLSSGSEFGVNPDSSSTGRMLYDQNGWPRILYEQPLTKTRRRHSYTPAGRPPTEPDLIPISLEEHLGQRTLRQETLGKLGEFEIRPTNYFDERSYPIGFGYDPDVVYLASSVGRETYSIYALNLKTRERVELTPGVQGFDLAPMEPAEADGILVFDEARKQLAGVRFTGLRPMTYWIDLELRDLQLAADELFPQHAVEIVTWDAGRKRFILRASSEEDPGAIFIYHAAEKRLERFGSRAPWLAGTELKPASSFVFETPEGVRLSGYITLPTNAKVDPPPLLIYCAAGLWDRAAPGFSREAEMLADMGVVVMRLNYRGSAGFGRSHLTALREGIDTVPMQDLIAAVDWLAARRPIDRKRVVVMGEGFGGYLALQAIRQHPDQFRAAISLNAPTNLRAWASTRQVTTNQITELVVAADPVDADGNVQTDNLDLSRTYDFRSVVREAFVKGAKRGDADISEAVRDGNFSKPVLLISNPLSNDLTPVSSLLGAFGLGLQDVQVQRVSINGHFIGGSFATRSLVFRRIEEFLNLNLYTFETDSENLRELKGPTSVPLRK